MSYIIKSHWETDHDESILGEMTIILFYVLWEILENTFPEQQPYQKLFYAAEDRKLENTLKSGWEKAKEVAEKDSSDTASLQLKKK